jgi:hypothetical protein
MKKEIKLMAEKEVSKILSNYVLGNKHPHIEYDFNENIFYINFEDCWLFFEEMFLLGYDDIRNVFETGIKKHFNLQDLFKPARSCIVVLKSNQR